MSLDRPLDGATDWTEPGPLGEMTSAEEVRLDELERAIEADMKGFLRVGNALTEVRDSRLYRKRFASFEEYCTNKWALSRKRAYDYIAGAAVVAGLQAVSPNGDTPLPANEGQARALAAAPPDDRADVMAAVAAKGKPTAKAIEAEVEARQPSPPLPVRPPVGAESVREVVWVCGECLTMVPEASHLTEGLCVDCRPTTSAEPTGTYPPRWTCEECGTLTSVGLVDGLCIPCWTAANPPSASAAPPPTPLPAPRPVPPRARALTPDERAEREAQERREDATEAIARSLAAIHASLMVPEGAEKVIAGWQPQIAKHHVLLFPELLTPDGIRGVARMLDRLAEVWAATKEEAA